MWESFFLLAIFDAYDVVYNWFISLLLPIDLDNLFGKICFYGKVFMVFSINS